MSNLRRSLAVFDVKTSIGLCLAIAFFSWLAGSATPVQANTNSINTRNDRAARPIDQAQPAHPGVVATATTYSLYLPVSAKEIIPPTPLIGPIDNSDQDTNFDVAWSYSDPDTQYILQQSLDPNFSTTLNVYQGPDHQWSATSKSPANYYYRVVALNSFGHSAWSNTQAVAIHPLFVGLSLQWDGPGYIRTNVSYNVGYHLAMVFDELTDADTIRESGSDYYDPNPEGWTASSWYDYFSVSTGDFKSSSGTGGGDPDWKWGDPWRTAYGAVFNNGDTVFVDGQPFTVSGPHSGTTAFGTATTYWEMVNKNDFVMWDGGQGWTQHVHPGEAIIRYEAGGLGYELYSNILRHDYYQGNQQPYTVQYIENLTACNICQGSVVRAQPDTSVQPAINSSAAESNDAYGPDTSGWSLP